MRVARLTRWGLALGCGLSLLLAACGGPADPAATADPGDAVVATAVPVDDGGDGEVVDTGDGPAPTPTADSGLAAHVPMLAGATDLKQTTDGTYIAYKAAETYDNAVAFYQAELVNEGWERVNNNDAEFGGSTTLLRTRPEANISVTIQSVAGDDNAVRVLISLSKK